MENFIYKKKWFGVSNPENPKSASVSIGSGDNGVVTVTYNKVGTEGNNYSIEVVEGSGVNVDLSAILNDTKITVTLGTDGVGALDATKNTATLVATAINTIDGFSAVVSGTGATAFAAAIAETDFTGGQYGTPCPETNTLIYVSPYYYLCTIAGNKDDVEWKRFQLTDY